MGIATLALGPAGTTLVSHSNARGDMARGGIINLVRSRYRQQAYPPDALPAISIDGMIAFCQAVLAELPTRRRRHPGDGPVTDRATLEAYVAMLASVRARVAELIADGKTLEEVVAARVTAEHEERYGEESRSMGFVDRVYTSLVRSKRSR